MAAQHGHPHRIHLGQHCSFGPAGQDRAQGRAAGLVEAGAYATQRRFPSPEDRLCMRSLHQADATHGSCENRV
jgi:hypothetical protein